MCNKSPSCRCSWLIGPVSKEVPAGCACRYADLIICYLREVATDVLTRSLAAKAMGHVLPTAAVRAWHRVPLVQQKAEHGHCWAGLREDGGNCSVAGGMGRNYNVSATAVTTLCREVKYGKVLKTVTTITVKRLWGCLRVPLQQP